MKHQPGRIREQSGIWQCPASGGWRFKEEREKERKKGKRKKGRKKQMREVVVWGGGRGGEEETDGGEVADILQAAIKHFGTLASANKGMLIMGEGRLAAIFATSLDLILLDIQTFAL